jgi:hypothetical protein
MSVISRSWNHHILSKEESSSLLSYWIVFLICISKDETSKKNKSWFLDCVVVHNPEKWQDSTSFSSDLYYLEFLIFIVKPNKKANDNRVEKEDLQEEDIVSLKRWKK